MGTFLEARKFYRLLALFAAWSLSVSCSLEAEIETLFSLDEIKSKDITVANEGEALSLSFEAPKVLTQYKVEYSLENLTTSDADFSQIQGVKIMGAGTSKLDLDVPLDGIYEEDEFFRVTLRITSTLVEGTWEETKTIRLINQDPKVQISVADVSVDESVGVAELVFNTDKVSTTNVVFDIATQAGSAISGADYTAINTQVVVPAGSLSATVSIPIVDDALYEFDETITVALTNSSDNVNLDTYTNPVITIEDNDTAPSLSIAGVVVNEAAGTADLTVTQSAVSGRDTTFNWLTSDGTALSGSDYTAVTSTLETIAAGSLTKTLSVSLDNDLLDEFDEIFTVGINTPVNATISDPSATATITDNDTEPSLSIADISVNEAAGTVDLTVTLSAESGKAVSFNWLTSNGTALSGSDYTAVTSTLETIAAGSLTKTLSVSIDNDLLDEFDETFTVGINTPMNASISMASATVTITDNDAEPSLSIADLSVNEAAGTADLTVTLSAESGKAVSFNWLTSNGTALSGSDYTAVTSTLETIAAGSLTKTLSVTINNDLLDEFKHC